MKKSLILVGMLSIGYAYAQEGSVGINTETPKATLEIVPNATNLAGTTNEGIIIPKLTKARVVAIAADKLVEGTKVYVTDEVTAADTQFIGAGKGFYFYNGTKWVKQLTSDTDTNSELWAQRDNAGVTETYLKPADANTDLIGYFNRGSGVRGWELNIGNIQNVDLAYSTTAGTGFKKEEAIKGAYLTSDAFPKQRVANGSGNFFFNYSNGIIRNTHASTIDKPNYLGHENRIVARDIIVPLGTLYGSNSSVDLFSNTTANAIYGGNMVTSVGSDLDNLRPTVTNNIGGQFQARNYGTSTNMYGGRFYVRNYGNATSLRGAYIVTDSQSTLNNATAEHTVSSVRGIQNFANLNDNGTLTGHIHGINNEVYVGNNTKFENNPLIRGIYSRINTRTTEHTETIINFADIFNPIGATITRYEGFTAFPIIGANTKITDLVGFRVGGGQYDATSTVENHYGIHIASITKGTNSNFAIHTGARGIVHIGDKLGVGTETPTQRIEANGNILANEGALMSRSERAIGGYLDLANTSKTEGAAVNRWRIYNMNNNDQYNYIPGMHFWGYSADGTNQSRMVITDEGNVGIGYGSRLQSPAQITEKLDVNGNVKAQSFLGANGATIFPDYVFQKYYTGTSSIKSDYSFKTLSQVEDFVKTNGHLPGYKSAETIKAQGYVDLMETQLTNVEKIEELYLHLMEKDKEVKTLQSRNEQLETKNQELESRLERLEKLIK